MKKLIVTFRQAIKALLANKGRSFLTILGIIIGIGSVIALISLGNGVQASISGKISTLGTTNITIIPGSAFGAGPSTGGPTSSSTNRSGGGGGRPTASTLTQADLDLLTQKTKHPDIKAATGDISGSAIFSVAGQDYRYTVLGTSVSYLDIHNLKLDKGTYFTPANIAAKDKVLVLGSQVAKDVFGDANPLGKTLVIDKDTYRIIGVLAKADENGLANPNTESFIPNSAAMMTFSTANFSSITAQATSEGVVDAVKADIQKTLLAQHGITNEKLADFSVNTSKDLLATVTSITGLLTSLLAGIAAISLVVGGIGIMNIMLVAVTERTREIGLRKAVGAKTGDILSQFVIESVLLTVIGGLLGVGLGVLVGKIVEKPIGFAPIVTAGSIMLAVGVSSAIGLIFGIYPAAKAARLNPIDALRYE